ncbi:MAG: hypothetical protein ACT4P7_11240 [Gemmatimonadaceae bacterium]
MTTKLDKALKREIEIDGVAYTVTLSPASLKIVEKGKRNGPEFRWGDLVGGSVTLTKHLEASLAKAGTRDEQADGSPTNGEPGQA